LAQEIKVSCIEPQSLGDALDPQPAGALNNPAELHVPVVRKTQRPGAGSFQAAREKALNASCFAPTIAFNSATSWSLLTGLLETLEADLDDGHGRAELIWGLVFLRCCSDSYFKASDAANIGRAPSPWNHLNG
jgi:hypothetical protein